jgi:hypothetical protein
MNKLTTLVRLVACMWVIAAVAMSAATVYAEGQAAGHGLFTPAKIRVVPQ